MSCNRCAWYEGWFGVCFNGESEYCADCPPYPETGCEFWKEKTDDEKDQ